jgi:hypothetical protein
MLAGFKSHFANSKLTKVKKTSDMVPQIGQGLVAAAVRTFFTQYCALKLYHLNIVWRYIGFFDCFERDQEKRQTKTYEEIMILGSPYVRVVAVNGKPLMPDQDEEQRKLDAISFQRQHESP